MGYRPITYTPLSRDYGGRALELLKLRQLRREIEGWIRVDHNSRYSFADVLDKLRDKLNS